MLLLSQPLRWLRLGLAATPQRFCSPTHPASDSTSDGQNPLQDASMGQEHSECISISCGFIISPWEKQVREHRAHLGTRKGRTGTSISFLLLHGCLCRAAGAPCTARCPLRREESSRQRQRSSTEDTQYIFVQAPEIILGSLLCAGSGTRGSRGAHAAASHLIQPQRAAAGGSRPCPQPHRATPQPRLCGNEFIDTDTR